MEKSTVTLGYGELTVEVTLDEIADALGEQYIIEDAGNKEFAYLAALVLETHDDNSYDLERSIMEFLRNEESIDLTQEQCNEIEEMLR
ncbi:hypothetical protein M199_gp250 [Halogranum tailed virus 1]|uniref:Uncharacterized protein n=1 Tax=Halogranum tailed virus 1 TaxID=1273749 RepID=R4TGQ3_9CAUD|nr:hypothetical protein M199_gp250 [Halogranum tailed virus 1]AGM11416.1 hypothetical protein HGTV1_118 [Halogranum tailed virus 1]